MGIDRALFSGAHGGQRDRRDGGEPSSPDHRQILLCGDLAARDRAELVTDDAGALRERLEAVTGERISALEGIGESSRREIDRDTSLYRERSDRETDAPSDPDKGIEPGLPADKAAEPEAPAREKRIEMDMEL